LKGFIMAHIPPLDQAVLRELADVIGATDSGLTNAEIDSLLSTSGIRDLNPQPKSPYLYRAINKRDRLYAALDARQRQDRAANTVLHFLECVMRPVRFRGRDAAFTDWRDALNETLAFAGLIVDEAGRVGQRSKVATTLNEARARSRHLRRQLAERGVHPRILAACGAEIANDNYFHTVLEATKSLASEIRDKTGLASDGVALIDQAFERGQREYPLLACNALQTPTQWSEQRGVANMLRGIFGAFRNPTAHEAKVGWHMSEQDALDALSVASLLHRKLDTCTSTASAATAIAS
jgi:uncharacterized protein (TIGR02391 family)